MSTSSRHDTTTAWLACADCQAPLDPAQRYCVSCGARHVQADNPAARYFGAVARRRPVAPPAPRRGVGIGVAVVIALLPLAVGGGVLVERSGHGDAGLLQALKSQRPTVVNVGGGAAGGAAVGATESAARATTASDTGVASGGSGNGAVLATGIGGTAHSVLNHKATATTRAHDRQVVRNLTHDKGQGYIKAQKSLPDVIDVPSDPGGGGTAPTGPGD